MGWAESRIILAERSIEDLYRRLLDATDQLKSVRQQLRAMDQQIPGSGPDDGGGGAYVCLAPSAVGGTWTGPTPDTAGSFSAEVFRVQGGTATSLGEQFVYNWMPAETVAGKACLLVPDGAGDFVVYAQSCT